MSLPPPSEPPLQGGVWIAFAFIGALLIAPLGLCTALLGYDWIMGPSFPDLPQPEPGLGGIAWELARFWAYVAAAGGILLFIGLMLRSRRRRS